jgi:hypothetical protein
MPSNKSFGIFVSIVIIIISLYPLLNSGNIRGLLIIPALFFLILGLLNSSILSPLNKIWFKFGILIGRFISPIVMAFIFFIVVTPISIIMKILNKNLLSLKKDKKKSYWIKRPLNKSKMNNQF